MNLVSAIFSDVNPIPVKEAMNLMGMDVGPCRMPLYEMDEQGRSSLAAVIRRHGLITSIDYIAPKARKGRCFQMTRIILSGCNGKMGRVITACVAERCDCKIVAGFDINTERHAGYPVYANPSNCQIEADVIIDFSHPSALNGVLVYAYEHKLPAVIATTGLAEEQVAELRKLSSFIPIFYSGNMSLGISLVTELARKAATVLGSDFDIEIIEKHHNQKIDAPSGTALMLADAFRNRWNTSRNMSLNAIRPARNAASQKSEYHPSAAARLWASMKSCLRDTTK